jgi:HD-GYP domain-containing protein (c-di-GMP phosphodiesterase class II)/MFS family permease
VKTLTPAARAYIAFIMAVGLALGLAMIWLDRAAFADIGSQQRIGDVPLLIFFVIFGLLASSSPVAIPGGPTLSASLAPLLAAVLILPPGQAAVVAAIGSIDSRVPGRELAWYRFLFNRAVLVIVYGSAALLFHALPGVPSTIGPSTPLDLNLLSAALIALVVIAVLNTPLVIVAVALATGQSMQKLTYETLQGLLLGYVGLAPVGALLAYLVSRRQLGGLFMAASVSILLLVYRELLRRSTKLNSVARGSYVSQSRLIDKKDRSTYGHSERVGLLAEGTATKLRLRPDLVEQIKIGATLHDIGKIAVPDSILHKTEPLTGEDWEILETHPEEGYDVLNEQEVLFEAAKIVRAHHENFDGTGYPHGLAGRAIPIGGRITRVADSYDCMINVRDYRPWTKKPPDAVRELIALAGTYYDPEVVQAFNEVLIGRHPEMAKELTGDEVRVPASIIDALRNSSYRKLWGAQGLSSFGDMLTTTGLALAAYGVSHSIFAVGAFFAARAVPNVLFGLIAGPLVDRYERKGLMILMDVARAVLIALLPFLLHTHNLPLLLGIAFTVSTATVVFNPARAAVLPDLLPGRFLQAGNAGMTLVDRLAEILGFAAAGLLVAFSGISLLFAIDAFTFVLSAGILLAIPFPEIIRRGTAEVRHRVSQDIADGLRYIRQVRELRSVFPFMFLMVLSGSALLPLMVPLALDHLRGGQYAFPFLEGSLAVGAGLGALAISFIETARRGLLMIVGALGMGGCVALAAVSNSLIVTGIFILIAGAANSAYLVPMVTAIHEASETEVRGRIFAARFTLVQVGVLIGIAYATFITPLLPTREPVVAAVLLSGLMMILVSASAAMSPTLRKI